jgi:hypothetical protein
MFPPNNFFFFKKLGGGHGPCQPPLPPSPVSGLPGGFLASSPVADILGRRVAFTRYRVNGASPAASVDPFVFCFSVFFHFCLYIISLLMKSALLS